MVEPIDPLAVLLRSVRVVGGEYCWPATEILNVLHAFENLDRVVLGAELWRFDDGEAPAVSGWTQYEVKSRDWDDRVVEASRKAADELLGFAGDQTAWVNLTWEARGERDR
jgi:hypothetical protein